MLVLSFLFRRWCRAGFIPLVATISLVACSTSETAHVKPAALQDLPASSYFEQTPVAPQLLLNRWTWGSNAASEAALKELGADGYLAAQLRPRQMALPSAVQAQIDAMTISQKPFVKIMEELDQQREAAAKMKGVDDSLRKAYQQELSRLAREAGSRAILRAVYSPNQLLEQMDWFWMNHFNLSSRKENLRAMLGDFEESAIRPHALGRFRDLLRATLLHPAMLRYLDNEHNAANKINENYARELMELHTMGVNSSYTQLDVQELARVLTGLGVRIGAEPGRLAQQPGFGRMGLTEFNPRRHDFGDKTLLGQIIRGRGIAELDQVLMILTRHPDTARFVSRKIAQYFVSDTPSDALVNAMAQRFLQTDGDIPAVLKQMFETQEFVASLGQKFKDPVHYVVSALRLNDAELPIVNAGPVLNWLNQLGQLPNGHQTPDGYAMNASAWNSAAQMTARFDVAKLIARGAPGLFSVNDTDMSAARINLAKNPYAKNWSQTFTAGSRDALTQSANAQEWSALFLSAPEMMTR